ncbi:unnamed protein product [Euphydryas editha]|uniref:Uncharacterized protein n=1 Tax=Euphydryas editha TaxID=104508 RepID=A0AAU9V805_EUPED|nr:unnamed protein product [Euphydryas editha]
MNKPETLYLVHTQEEKKLLLDQGCGISEGSHAMTIHAQAQGQIYGEVIIVESKTENFRIDDSVPHTVVAVQKHLCLRR